LIEGGGGKGKRGRKIDYQEMELGRVINSFPF